jgi:hypothetical protein
LVSFIGKRNSDVWSAKMALFELQPLSLQSILIRESTLRWRFEGEMRKLQILSNPMITCCFNMNPHLSPLLRSQSKPSHRARPKSRTKRNQWRVGLNTLVRSRTPTIGVKRRKEAVIISTVAGHPESKIRRGMQLAARERQR